MAHFPAAVPVNVQYYGHVLRTETALAKTVIFTKTTQVETTLIGDLKFSHQNQSFICLERRLNVYGSFFMK
jgi:hypothetical protein